MVLFIIVVVVVVVDDIAVGVVVGYFTTLSVP
jgi:hypothetical protein